MKFDMRMKHVPSRIGYRPIAECTYFELQLSRAGNGRVRIVTRPSLFNYLVCSAKDVAQLDEVWHACSSLKVTHAPNAPPTVAELTSALRVGLQSIMDRAQLSLGLPRQDRKPSPPLVDSGRTQGSDSIASVTSEEEPCEAPRRKSQRSLSVEVDDASHRPPLMSSPSFVRGTPRGCSAPILKFHPPAGYSNTAASSTHIDAVPCANLVTIWTSSNTSSSMRTLSSNISNTTPSSKTDSGTLPQGTYLKVSPWCALLVLAYLLCIRCSSWTECGVLLAIPVALFVWRGSEVKAFCGLQAK
jgi:hypothetical protein